MGDWEYVQEDPTINLVRLHYFAMTKRQPDGDIEFRITVQEHASNPGNGMRFFAETDKQTNQSTAPFTPCGWGNSLGEALGECLRSIDRFPYEGPHPESE